jgi:hypothetical protein
LKGIHKFLFIIRDTMIIREVKNTERGLSVLERERERESVCVFPRERERERLGRLFIMKR